MRKMTDASNEGSDGENDDKHYKQAKEVINSGPDLDESKLTKRDIALLKRREYDEFWISKVSIDDDADAR